MQKKMKSKKKKKRGEKLNEEEEDSNKKVMISKGPNYFQQGQLKALRLVLANSDLSFSFLKKQHFDLYASNFSRLKASIKKIGFKESLFSTQKRGCS